MLKKELRKFYLQKRRGLLQGERERLSAAVAMRFFDQFDLSKVQAIHCFLPIEKFAEIDTNFIFSRIWEEFPHIETVAPRVDFDRDVLEHLRFRSTTPLYENEWNINEPVSDEFVDVRLLDIVIVPLLAVDQRGFRVGYGKGFYDKFLAECRDDCKKIGVSFFPPVEEINDTNENDVRLDYCLTPDSLIEF